MQLVTLQSRYSDQYPDVVSTKAEIAELDEPAHEFSRRVRQPHNSNNPDNPAYITLISQLSGVQTDIAWIKRQIKEAKKMGNIYRQD